MAYDEALARRVRAHFEGRSGVSERKMFGGVCILLNGNMCCGVAREELMLRLGEAGAAEALLEAGVREMDFTGRPMKSMVFVNQAALATDEALATWLDRAAAFAATLPAK